MFFRIRSTLPAFALLLACIPAQPPPRHAAPPTEVQALTFFVDRASDVRGEGLFGAELGRKVGDGVTDRLPTQMREAGLKVVPSFADPHDIEVRLTGECADKPGGECHLQLLLMAGEKKLDTLKVDCRSDDDVDTVALVLANGISES
ncbi:MAG: hypothetical protein ACK4N5_17245, partial [Myxococcales bacterium]